MSVAMRTCGSGIVVRFLGALVLGIAMAGAMGGCGGSVTGTWVLDKEMTLAEAEKKFEKEMADAGPMAEMARSMMRSMFESATIEMRINGDKTFVMSGTMGPESVSTTGKWEKVKEGYRMTPNDAGPVTTAKVVSGRLIFQSGGSDDPAMYLRRK